MTNEEAIKILNKINPFNDNSKMQEYFESVEIAINSIQENTKLKAEIEQLKNDSKIVAKELVAQIREIGRLKTEKDSAIALHKDCSSELNMRMKEICILKSELEQSVKLPCKVGDTIYVNLPYQKPRKSYLREVVGFRYMSDTWFIETKENDYPFYDIGHSIFITREEAEQSLKGQV